MEKLTNEEIKEAIEKKWCPFCKDECKSFYGTVDAWQEFWFTDKGELIWEDLEGDDEMGSITCKECGEEIPEEVWKNWLK